MEPQPPATVELQETLHVTPPGARSFVTAALTDACDKVVSVEGGCCTNAMAGPGVTIVVTALAEFEIAAADVAVMVTVWPAGIAAGAV
jgi:hypothetical protein